MVGVGGSGQSHHANIESEAEDNLANGPTVALGDEGHFGASQHLTIGRQQRKTLVNYVICSAELADATIPTSGGVTAILHKSRANTRLLAKRLELFQRDIADTEHADEALLVDGFHRAPRGPIVGSQTDALAGTVQHKGVNSVGAKMFQGTFERLLDLERDRGFGIVRQAMILAALKGEFGLKEKIVAHHQTARDDRGDGLADASFVVVLSLVGGIDAAKALLQREF